MERGYIGLSVIVFLIVISMILYPWIFPVGSPHDCVVGDPPDHPQTISGIPAIKDLFAEPDFRGNEPIYGGPDPTETAEYVLIRRNVPTSKKTTPDGWEFLGGKVATDHTHTINVGELSVKPGYDAYYPSRWGEMDLPGKGRKYIRGLGLLIFANNDPTTIIQDGENTIYLTDVYMDKRVYEDGTKGFSHEDMFICGIDTVVGDTFVVSPAQLVSPKKDQLQLEWFLLGTDMVWGVHCKPAVYLYPPRKQLINVKVNPRGELSYTDPPYDKKRGWTVNAFPDGTLFSINHQPITNNYLYYESKIHDFEIKKPVNGWSVKKEDIGQLFNEILPKLGLNEKEKRDFSEYWLKALPDSPYYFVGLIEKGQRDYLEELKVTPSPDTSIRFSLFFEPLRELIPVTEPEIRTPIRNGFTLVDWGGMVKLHPGTPFTCSQ